MYCALIRVNKAILKDRESQRAPLWSVSEGRVIRHFVGALSHKIVTEGTSRVRKKIEVLLLFGCEQ